MRTESCIDVGRDLMQAHGTRALCYLCVDLLYGSHKAMRAALRMHSYRSTPADGPVLLVTDDLTVSASGPVLD